jgi:Ca2+-binding RTX toxin-like protein
MRRSRSSLRARPSALWSDPECTTKRSVQATGSGVVSGDLNPIGNDGALQVTTTDRTTEVVVYQQRFASPVGGFAQIVIFGQGADDHIQIAGSINLSACVHAGAGADDVMGGGGNDLLPRETSDDKLLGGGGRAVMIGGVGADRLIGNHDEDLASPPAIG